LKNEINELLSKIEVVDEEPKKEHKSTIKYDNSQIPIRHRDFRPSHSKSERWSETYEEIKSVIKSGGVSCMVGNRGSGKTQMACCLVGYVTVNNQKTAQYIKFLDMTIALRPKENEPLEDRIKKFCKPYFLVIDAYEVRGDSSFEKQMINHIVDKRYDDMKPTIIISNDTVDNITKVVGESITDRIKETGALFEFNWGSFRK
jgi:DNA replication protein DnaC